MLLQRPSLTPDVLIFWYFSVKDQFADLTLFLRFLRLAAARREPPHAAESERLLGAVQAGQEARFLGQGSGPDHRDTCSSGTTATTGRLTACVCLIE